MVEKSHLVWGASVWGRNHTLKPNSGSNVYRTGVIPFLSERLWEHISQFFKILIGLITRVRSYLGVPHKKCQSCGLWCPHSCGSRLKSICTDRCRCNKFGTVRTRSACNRVKIHAQIIAKYARSFLVSEFSKIFLENSHFYPPTEGR